MQTQLYILQDSNNDGVINYSDLDGHYNYTIKIDLDNEVLPGHYVVIDDGKTTGYNSQVRFKVNKFNIEDGALYIARVINIESSYSITAHIEDAHGNVIKTSITRTYTISGIPSSLNVKYIDLKCLISNIEGADRVIYLFPLISIEGGQKEELSFNYEIYKNSVLYTTGTSIINHKQSSFTGSTIYIFDYNGIAVNPIVENIQLKITSITGSSLVSYNVLQDTKTINSENNVLRNFDTSSYTSKMYGEIFESSVEDFELISSVTKSITDGFYTAYIKQGTANNFKFKISLTNILNDNNNTVSKYFKAGDNINLYIRRNSVNPNMIWSSTQEEPSASLIGIYNNNTNLNNIGQYDTNYLSLFKIGSFIIPNDFEEGVPFEVSIPYSEILDVKNNCGSIYDFVCIKRFEIEENTAIVDNINDNTFFKSVSDYFITPFKPKLSINIPTTEQLTSKTDLNFSFNIDRKWYTDIFVGFRFKSNGVVSDLSIPQIVRTFSEYYFVEVDGSVNTISNSTNKYYFAKIPNNTMVSETFSVISNATFENIEVEIIGPFIHYQRYTGVEIVHDFRNNSKDQFELINPENLIFTIGGNSFVKDISEIKAGSYNYITTVYDQAFINISGNDNHPIGSSFTFNVAQGCSLILTSTMIDTTNGYRLKCIENNDYINGMLHINSNEVVKIRKISANTFYVSYLNKKTITEMNKLADTNFNNIIANQTIVFENGKWVNKTIDSSIKNIQTI